MIRFTELWGKYSCFALYTMQNSRKLTTALLRDEWQMLSWVGQSERAKSTILVWCHRKWHVALINYYSTSTRWMRGEKYPAWRVALSRLYLVTWYKTSASGRIVFIKLSTSVIVAKCFLAIFLDKTFASRRKLLNPMALDMVSNKLFPNCLQPHWVFICMRIKTHFYMYGWAQGLRWK